MSNEKQEKKKQDEQHKDAAVQPDPETLHTTDPQDKMEGPVSSVMQNIKEGFDSNDDESKEEADAEKDKNM